MNLIVINTPERGRIYELHQPAIHVMGRLCGSVSLSDTSVSRLHAEIFTDDDVWHIDDMGSTNGTFLNGQRVTDKIRLNDGDQIKVGETTLVVDLSG